MGWIWFSALSMGNKRGATHCQVASKFRLRFGYFISHVKAEYPALKTSNINELVQDNPYDLIELSILLSHRNTFRGTCEVCESWYKE